MMKIKSILVTQPRPENEKSLYAELSKKYKVRIDFLPFFTVEGVHAKEFRRKRINLADYTGVIITSRNCIHHYFRLCAEMRYEVPEEMKYFCTSETIAWYIQKYTQLRKRRTFAGHNMNDLVPFLRKYKNEKFLLPCSNVHNREIDRLLNQEKIIYRKALFYRTVPSDLSCMKPKQYDILAFFSPADIKSLIKNFPGFRQGGTRIAAFGATTAKAVENAGLRLNIHAPTPESPSMAMALENFLRNSKNGKK